MHLLLLLAVLSLMVIPWIRSYWKPSFPRGPPRLPLLGHLLSIPKSAPHLQFTAWARQYGDVYALKVGRGTMVILSSATAVRDLMDKRSLNFAERPTMYFAELISQGNMITTGRFTPKLRASRKAMNNLLTSKAAQDHVQIQSNETAQMIFDILCDPERFRTHIIRQAFSSVQSMVYGKRCPRHESKDAKIVRDINNRLSPLFGSTVCSPIDLIPALRYIPERWAPWKTECREVRKMLRKLYFGLFEECQKALEDGQEIGCYIENALKSQSELSLDPETIAYLGGSLVAAGTGTSATFLDFFVLFMVAFPDVQRKAHDEIDAVVGTIRMPVLDDFKNLPYLDAVIKELHRIRPILPLSLSHATFKDEYYRGCLIPGGSTVIQNTWAIFHDPDAFEEPERFWPERFLGTLHGTRSGYDDSAFRQTLLFGSGRRICPGMNVGENNIKIATMALLWSFNFSEATDPQTKQIVPVDINNYLSGTTITPAPFRCSIMPRSEGHKGIIEREYYEATNGFIPYEQRLDKEDKEWITENRRR